MSDVVLGATEWPTNAALIADVARLGYLSATDRVIDVTYGEGNWWDLWRPDNLVASDLYKGPLHHDFRDVPFPDGSFDVVAYDPPYVAIGGKETSGIKTMHAAYGMAGPDFSNPAGLQEIMHDGLTEAVRLVAQPRRSRSGRILAKSKNYVTSGKMWMGTHKLAAHALELGCEILDVFTHIGDPGPQPGERTRRCGTCHGRGCSFCTDGRVLSEQAHARQNCSTLLVLQAPKAKPPPGMFD